MSLLIFVASLFLAALSLPGIRWAYAPNSTIALRLRALAFAVIALSVVSCKPRDRAEGDTRRGALMSVPRDTMPPDIPPYEQLNADSLRARMDTLETALSRASEADRPQLLFELGRAKRLFIPEKGTAHGNYAAAREDEYFYNEIGGNYIYTGTHLKELIDRYPQHDLADDAGYELTLLPGSGECEGFVTCYIGREWNDVQPFLQRFATSAYATRAVDRMITAYQEALKDVSDLAVATDMYDPKELRPLLASFDSVGVTLPGQLRDKATTVGQSIWPRLGGKP